jgi:hypothetical protein
MNSQQQLEHDIEEAWAEFNEIATEEEEGDYSDAMLSMARTHAEGYAEGLEEAYYIIYKERYQVKSEAGVDNA